VVQYGLRTQRHLKDLRTKWEHHFVRVLGGPERFWFAKRRIFVKQGEHFHHRDARFQCNARQLMVLSLERIIWYNFNGFLHVEIFVEETFFPRKKVTR
jgi:hypothetical protein